MYRCRAYVRQLGNFWVLPSCGRLFMIFSDSLLCILMCVRGINMSLSELTGARTFNCWCVVSWGRGEKQACFYHVSANIDIIYCIIWQKFFCWGSQYGVKNWKSNNELFLSLEVVLPKWVRRNKIGVKLVGLLSRQTLETT